MTNKALINMYIHYYVNLYRKKYIRISWPTNL